MRNSISLTILAIMGIGCAARTAPIETPAPEAAPEVEEAAPAEAPAPTSSYLAAADIQWQPNPEAPDGPQLAVLSGNPQEGAFTFMVKFPAGHISPVHSHTHDFAGALISGTLFHGGSSEEFETLTAGAAMSQPGNEVHFTECSSESDCIVVGHMSGPMDTIPAETGAEGELLMVLTAADSADFQPINPERPDGPAMFVIGGDHTTGAFQALVKLPAGSASPNHSHSHSYSAALLSGSVTHEGGEGMEVGSAWTNVGGQAHVTGCMAGEEDCIFFASMEGAFDMSVVEAPAEEAPAPAEEAAAPAEEAAE